MEKHQHRHWVQYFNKYCKAFTKLKSAIITITEFQNIKNGIDDLMMDGLIQRFEYTHELAWMVMKGYAEYQGYTDVRGSRDAIRKALEMNLIDDKRWMDTIEDRNLTVHNYDNEIASEIYDNIMSVYAPLFVAFEGKMQSLIEPTLFD